MSLPNFIIFPFSISFFFPVESQSHVISFKKWECTFRNFDKYTPIFSATSYMKNLFIFHSTDVHITSFFLIFHVIVLTRVPISVASFWEGRVFSSNNSLKCPCHYPRIPRPSLKKITWLPPISLTSSFVSSLLSHRHNCSRLEEFSVRTPGR